MNWKFDMNVSAEESFSYPIDRQDSFNGEYKRLTGDYRFLLVGKNPDANTYRVYFIRVGSAVLGSTVKDIVLRLDDLALDSNGTGKFKNSEGQTMKITFRNKSITVDSDMSLGDASLQGTYQWQKSIDKFSMTEFQIFK